jgi:hypothetical protein
MTALRIDKGRKLASIRTVRSHIPPIYRIDLYEHWVEIGPGGRKGCPVKGALITIGKAGAGATIASGLTFGATGAAVARMRQHVTISGGGYTFSAYCYGRDRQELHDFVQAFQAAAAA